MYSSDASSRRPEDPAPALTGFIHERFTNAPAGAGRRAAPPLSGIFRERYGECMDIRKLLASGLLVGVMTLGAACQWLSPPTPTKTPWQTAPTPMTYPSREELPSVARRTDSTPPYIWIPKYADPFMADKMVNSFPATVVTLCTGIFGGVWSPNDPNSNFWETYDICAVNAQLGFPDPTGVATKGCALESSGCKKYRLRR